MGEIFKIVHEVSVKVNKEIDDAVLGEIREIAKENGVCDEIVLNHKAISNALLKSQKRKIYYDRESYVCCPNCENSYNLNQIFRRQPKYCPDCGQALDWEV